MRGFDDSLLDAPGLVDDEGLRWLAGAGARIRSAMLAERIGSPEFGRPRGVIALGAEARLIRAVLEPVCPVPFVAWPAEGLPSWVGPLDLVVLLDGGGDDRSLLGSAVESVRRGAMMMVVAPGSSELATVSASRSTLLLPAQTHDATAAAVVALAHLHRLGLGPLVVADQVADAADRVAESCSPLRDLSTNPAKEMALAMADDVPLIWGATVLAARASRRIAEAVRAVSGRSALAVDADDLLSLFAGLERKDTFADPFDEPAQSSYPALVVLEDGGSPAVVRHTQIDVTAQANALGLRVHTVSAGETDPPGTDVDRYVTLLQHGLYGAAYLGIGLGRPYLPR